MKNKRVIALLLSVILILTPIQQVNAETMNPDVGNEQSKFEVPEMDEENVQESEKVSNNEGIDEAEKIDESDQDEVLETEDKEENVDLSDEQDAEENIEPLSSELEILDEPERPENLPLGAYVKSDLDYNTPVYSSDYDTYSNIPSAFPEDMSDIENVYPNARNQSPYGTCWAFSSIGLAEFDLINDSLNGKGEFDSNIDLSELQLAYFTYNSVLDPLGGTEGDSAKYHNENAEVSYLNYGGNYAMASRRLAQWCGPADESTVSYSQAADTITNGLDASYAYGFDEAHLENAYLINIKENVDDVKQQIMEHGAAGIMYYHNDASFGWNTDLQKYTYYDAEVSGGGHAVMIVGWDDDFSKDNFTGSSAPSEDGAWLVRNSWGSYADYFWMSYETASLADTAWIFDFSAENEYDNNYQLDGGIQTYPDKQHKTLANVFKTKQEDGVGQEILSAVSLSFTQAANVHYTVDIYTDLTDEIDPLSGTKQEYASTEGETAYAGIYTIPLNSTVTLQPGTLFAVVVSVDAAILDYEQATSIATGDDLSTMIWDCKVSQNNNKSFFLSGEAFQPYYWGNYCIKAFTSDEDIEQAVYRGADYSSVYDYQYYVDNNPDILAAFNGDRELTLAHFVNNGMNEGRQGSERFSVVTYRRRYADLRRAFGNNLKSYYMHYITNGKNEGRTGSGTSQLMNPETVYDGIDYSSVYDYEYYRENNPDIKEAFGDDDQSTLVHFVNSGMSEARRGNEDFNVYTYRNRYVDLRRAFGNNLKSYYMHYITNGKNEGRTGSGTSQLMDPATVYNGIDYSSIYDYEYYMENNSDIKEAFEDDDQSTLAHFVNSGMSEGRRGNEDFNVQTYRKRYADLRNAYGDDLKKYYMHYLLYGKKEGRSGAGTSELIGFMTIYQGVDYSLVYNYNYYVENNPDIKVAFGDDDYAVLQHFVTNGMSEGRIGSSDFNVFVYKENYGDLQSAFGKDLRAYCMHYLNSGRKEGRTGSIRINGIQAFRIQDCVVSNYDESELTVVLDATYINSSVSLDEDFYVVLRNSKGTNGIAIEKGTVSSNGTISISATFTDNDSFKAFAMGKYAIAVKRGDYYQIVSDSCMLKNPEAMTEKEEGFKDRYWGYYENYKVYSKKGIQGTDDVYTADLGAQHVLLNADIQDLVSAGPHAGYISYTYKGIIYYFSDLIALKKTIYDLHGWGSDDGNAYGEGITRNVTLVLLMSWKHDELSYLIHPSARVKGAAPYYSLNMQDEDARDTFEALFCYMGEELGQMKTRVNNWTLGNELNSCKAWNYAGSMPLNDYVANYAQAFQMLNQAVRRTAASPRLFISLDHCWNVAEAGFTGKAFLDTFASYMNQTAPYMQWNVNFHSYSQPLSNNAFWNDRWNTTDSISTRYISMRNISVLTDYRSGLEQT